HPQRRQPGEPQRGAAQERAVPARAAALVSPASAEVDVVDHALEEPSWQERAAVHVGPALFERRELHGDDRWYPSAGARLWLFRPEIHALLDALAWLDVDGEVPGGAAGEGDGDGVDARADSEFLDRSLADRFAVDEHLGAGRLRLDAQEAFPWVA